MVGRSGDMAERRSQPQSTTKGRRFLEAQFVGKFHGQARNRIDAAVCRARAGGGRAVLPRRRADVDVSKASEVEPGDCGELWLQLGSFRCYQLKGVQSREMAVTGWRGLLSRENCSRMDFG